MFNHRAPQILVYHHIGDKPVTWGCLSLKKSVFAATAILCFHLIPITEASLLNQLLYN